MNKSGNKRLKKLMKKHQLKMDDVAEGLHVVKETVKSWRRPEGTAAYRNMPEGYIKLLEILCDENPEFKRVTPRTRK